jgi:hypothetical protein
MAKHSHLTVPQQIILHPKERTIVPSATAAQFRFVISTRLDDILHKKKHEAWTRGAKQ